MERPLVPSAKRANSSGRPASVTSPVSTTKAGRGFIALRSLTSWRSGSTLPLAVRCVSVMWTKRKVSVACPPAYRARDRRRRPVRREPKRRMGLPSFVVTALRIRREGNDFLFYSHEALTPQPPTGIRLHYWMQRQPLFSIRTAAQALNLTQPTVTSAIEHLKRLNILREISGRRRNRLFAYDAYLRILEEGTELS